MFSFLLGMDLHNSPLTGRRQCQLFMYSYAKEEKAASHICPVFCETASLKCRLLHDAATTYTSWKIGVKCSETMVGKYAFLFCKLLETNKDLYEIKASPMPTHRWAIAHSKGCLEMLLQERTKFRKCCLTERVPESKGRRKWKKWMKEAEISPWKRECEEALRFTGPWCGERRRGLTVVLRKPNFVNKRERAKDILFHLWFIFLKEILSYMEMLLVFNKQWDL